MVAVNRLEEFALATPVFTDGRICIRTAAHLYRIGIGANRTAIQPATRSRHESKT